MLFLHSIFNGIWSITPDFAANYLPLIASYIKAEDKLNLIKPISSSSNDPKVLSESNGIRTMVLKNGVYTLSEYGGWVAPEDAPEDSIAIININGAISKYDQDCGPAGMKTKSDLAFRCAANNRIKGLGFVVDSGGGETRAMFTMDETIQSVKKKIPVGCFVDDAAYSAAAGIASSCDFIVANNKNAGFGSFGTYATIVDYTEYYKNLGINIIEVYADASKDKNQPFIQALKGNDKLLKELVNNTNDSFLAMVEANRGSLLTAKRDEWATGKTFYAPEAKDMGLIDDIGNFEYFIDYFNT